MISKLKDTAADYFLRKAVNAFPRRKTTMDIDNAGSLLILSDAHGATLEFIRKYARELRGKKKKVLLIIFVPDNKNAMEDADYVLITKKETNWYNKPKQALLKEYTAQPYDLILDLSENDCWPLLFTAASANAFLRAGMYSEKKKIVHDVLLHKPENSSIKEFIQQAEYYLNIISKKT